MGSTAVAKGRSARASGTGSSDWRATVARYQVPDVRRALLQLVTTLAALAVALTVMYWSLRLSYWLTLALAIPTAGFLVRTFIIMHDCAHGSFLPSRRINDAIGFVTGVLTFTPFGLWRREHALHHASSGDLDRRGNGDIDTITVREYLARSHGGRFRYRLCRHPGVMLGLGPLHLMITQRIPPRGENPGARQASSVWWTNGALAALVVGMSLLIGWRALLLVYFPVMYLAALAGIWLFYVQHQFEGTYWEEHKDWNYVSAAIGGASYCKLPALLQWFTGSIGLHHVHHLGPRIPNYNLQRCHDENALFHDATVVTLRDGITAFRLRLWDEDRHRLVGLADVVGA